MIENLLSEISLAWFYRVYKNHHLDLSLSLSKKQGNTLYLDHPGLLDRGSYRINVVKSGSTKQTIL